MALLLPEAGHMLRWSHHTNARDISLSGLYRHSAHGSHFLSTVALKYLHGSAHAAQLLLLCCCVCTGLKGTEMSRAYRSYKRRDVCPRQCAGARQGRGCAHGRHSRSAAWRLRFALYTLLAPAV
jgi:hypothetical protein